MYFSLLVYQPSLRQDIFYNKTLYFMLQITCIIIFEAKSFQDLDFFCKVKKSGTWKFAELDNCSCGIYVDLTLNSLSLWGAVSILDVIKNYPSNPLTFSEPIIKRG